ncbi:condensation protein [Streptomyces cyaneofuscatus]|uniref:phthiocerol/phthiodiolone dimycocerosyl transferase family protein n=1 Tax=Streptomyces cyaneofuscatus TaxID=66883 RepID=UPI00380F1AC1
MAERLLAPHEAAIHTAGVRVVLQSTVEGALDEEVLAQALAHLYAGCPLLGARIVPDRDGRAVVRTGEVGRGPVLGHGADFDEEINTPQLWEEDPLLRMTLLREPGRTRVVLTLPRAFVDGMSYLDLHHRLWDIYSALATGHPLPPLPQLPVLGPSLDELLAARFTPEGVRDFVAARARLDAHEPPALVPALASHEGGPGPHPAFRLIGIDTGADRSARLAQAARDASLTLNSLVSGVLLTSLHSLLPPAPGPRPVLCTTAVDMRRRLSPPLSAGLLQSAATTATLRLRIGEADHPATVGQEVAAQLRAALDSGDAARELAAFPYMLDQHPPSLVITNVGTITVPAVVGGLRVTGVRLAPLGHVPMIFAVVSRYQGRLAVDLSYSTAWYTDQQIQEFARRVSAGMENLLRTA